MSLLQLPEGPDVAWARLLPTGGEGGGAAFQIDASGLELRNRMMYRMLIPNSAPPSIRVVARLTSTLTVGNPAFEGLAARFRGFKLNGTSEFEPVWDSTPEYKGRRAWYAEQSATWTDAVFVEPVPPGNGIDLITVELYVRATGGQVTLSNVDCRNHYAIPYALSTWGNQLWTSGFNRETLALGADGDASVLRLTRYIKTVPTSIRTGKLVTVSWNSILKGRAIEEDTSVPGSTRRLAAEAGVMLKMGRRLGGHDYVTLEKQSVSVENKTVLIDGSTQFKAQYDYFQTEVIVFVEPEPLSSSEGFDYRTADRMGFTDMRLDMYAMDYITASQS